MSFPPIVCLKFSCLNFSSNLFNPKSTGKKIKEAMS